MLKINIENYQINDHFQLSNVKFKILPGEIFALIGKSGSGKSSVASLLTGINISNKTSIILHDVELNNGMERLMAQFSEAGYLPQNLHLKPFHTVNDFLNIQFQRFNKQNLNKIKIRYIKLFRLSNLLDTKIQNLSGGEKQKMALIEAISQPISYLVLDEPFSQLDTEQKIEFSAIVMSIIRDKNIPCLLISHDLSDVLNLAQNIGILHRGKMIFQGSWDKFSNSKNRAAQKLKVALLQWKNQTNELVKNLNIV